MVLSMEQVILSVNIGMLMAIVYTLRIVVLLEKKIDVSPWYPRLDEWYHLQEEQNWGSLKNSIYFSDHVLNFWIDETHSVKRIKRNAVKINKIINNISIEEI